MTGHKFKAYISKNYEAVGKMRTVIFAIQYIYSMKRELMFFAKSNDPCQPAQSAQVDMVKYFSPSSKFLHVQG